MGNYFYYRLDISAIVHYLSGRIVINKFVSYLIFNFSGERHWWIYSLRCYKCRL